MSHGAVCGGVSRLKRPFRAAICIVLRCNMCCFALQYGLFCTAIWHILHHDMAYFVLRSRLLFAAET